MDDKSTSYKSGGFSEKVKHKKVVSKICCMESTYAVSGAIFIILAYSCSILVQHHHV